MKVAIIIPTMNRPDFILRHLKFCELMNSLHPVYLSDSSNEENAQKIKEGIKEIKKIKVIYQWAPPDKDHMHQLLPLVEEKYCIQTGDDDLIIPNTISECAEFLKSNPDYGTCIGKQVNIRLREEDYDKPYGIIGRCTQPMGRSLEDDDMLVRVKNFWSKTFFIPFVVRRTETERLLRDITKHFSLREHMLEFLVMSTLLISGKCKSLNKLAYIMQVNNKRYAFECGVGIDLITAPSFEGKWKICEKGLSEVVQKKSFSREESLKIVRAIFTMNLANQFRWTADALPIGRQAGDEIAEPISLDKKLRRIMSNNVFLKKVYYKFNSPNDVTRPESKYFNDFKIVKDFLEFHRQF